MKKYYHIILLIYCITIVSASDSCLGEYSWTTTVNVTGCVERQIYLGEILLGMSPSFGGGSTHTHNILSTHFGNFISTSNDKYYFGTSDYHNFNIEILSSGGTWVYSNIENKSIIQVNCTVASFTDPNFAHLRINLNETSRNTYPITPASGSDIINITKLNWSVGEGGYSRKWTFLNESNSNPFNFTAFPSNLTVVCPNYEDFQYNLSSTTGVQTKERVMYIMQVNNNSVRIRADNDDTLVDNYYIIQNYDNAQQYHFTLQDYTGGNCYRSTLYISKPPDKNIDVQQFSNNNDIYATLINNTYYTFTVKCDDLTRNLGSFLITDDDLDRTIIISTPEFNNFQKSWDNLSIEIDSDYDTNTITCGIQYPSTVTGYMNVYNWTNNAKVLDGNTTLSASNMTLTVTVDNVNLTYYVICGATDGTWRNELSGLFNIRNHSAIMSEFDLDLPAELFGLSRQFLYSIAAVVITIIIITLGSGITYTIFGIIGTFTATFFYYIGYLTSPYEFYITLVFMAIMLHIVRNRRGTE